jgi:hypothetical protein
LIPTHIFLQGEALPGGYANILNIRWPAGSACHGRGPAGTGAGFTTLRDVETEGAGYGDVGIKMAIEGGYIPAASVCSYPCHLHHRWI